MTPSHKTQKASLAAVINMANRAAGRTGMGAVMGSKRLKAIAVRGSSKKIPLARPADLNRLARAGTADIPNNPDMALLARHGTEGVLEGVDVGIRHSF